MSRTKVESGTLPSFVYADKYQTQRSKGDLPEEGAGGTEKRDALRQGHITKRVGDLWDKAMDNISNKYPDLRNDPDYTLVKSKLTKYMGRGKPASSRAGVGDYPIYYHLLPQDIHPTKEKGERTLAATALAHKWAERNKKEGITGLTKEQSKVIDKLAQEEFNAWDKYREYIQARNMYSIGGDFRTADFTKEDVLSERPIEFHESDQKPHAVHDLRTEYRLTNVPHTLLRHGRSAIINTGDKRAINRFWLPTTVPDQEYIDSIPLGTKLAGRTGVLIQTVKERLKRGSLTPEEADQALNKIMGGVQSKEEPEEETQYIPPIYTTDTSVGFKKSKYKAKSKTKKPVYAHKKKVMDDILFGIPHAPKKKPAKKSRNELDQKMNDIMFGGI
jgi:hypothetical protein